MGSGSIERLARSLALAHHSLRFALWSPDGQALWLECSVGLSQRVWNDAAALWAGYREDFEQGRTQTIEGGVLKPLAGPAGRCVGLLFLEKQALDAEGDDHQRRAGQELAAALADKPREPLFSPSIVARSDVVQRVTRARLLFLLERHDWTVAVVARAMKVSRDKVYLLMSRFGIQRPAPAPKAPRRYREPLSARHTAKAEPHKRR